MEITQSWKEELVPTEAVLKRVADEFGWLPAEAQEVAAGYLMLLERAAEPYGVLFGRPSPPQSATSIAERSRRPQSLYELQREYEAVARPIAAAFSRFLMAYPRPIIMRSKTP